MLAEALCGFVSNSWAFLWYWIMLTWILRYRRFNKNLVHWRLRYQRHFPYSLESAPFFIPSTSLCSFTSSCTHHLVTVHISHHLSLRQTFSPDLKLKCFANSSLHSLSGQGWNCRGGVEPPSSCLQTLIFEWKPAINFNPWTKFQTFRHLTPLVLLGQFQVTVSGFGLLSRILDQTSY